MNKEKWVSKRAEDLSSGDPAKVLQGLSGLGIMVPSTTGWRATCEMIAEAEWHGLNTGPVDPVTGWPLSEPMPVNMDEEPYRYVHTMGLDVGPGTESAHCIIEHILPDVLNHFLKDNADYGDNHREGLGARAEFVGIHRKVKKLEKALWLGEDMNGEGVEEMLTDLIGQCLIILDLLALERAPK